MPTKIKLKYKVRQLASGKWAVYKNAKLYFSTHLYESEADAIYASLLREGHELVEKIDSVQDRLEAIGRVDERDPHAWRA